MMQFALGAVVLAACVLAAAGDVVTVELQGNSCEWVKLGSSSDTEIALYNVSTSMEWQGSVWSEKIDEEVLTSAINQVFGAEADTASESCNPFIIFQSTQDTPLAEARQHWNISQQEDLTYDDWKDMVCEAIMNSTGAWSPDAPEEAPNLVPLPRVIASGATYAVCTGIDWSKVRMIADWDLAWQHSVEPWDTYILFANKCEENVTLMLDVQKVAEGSEVDYCNALQGASAGNQRVMFFGAFQLFIVNACSITLFSMWTRCCSCCCPPHRPGCKGPNRVCKKCCRWTCCAWMMEEKSIDIRHGNLAPYMMFWSFSFIAISLTSVVRKPKFDVPDVLTSEGGSALNLGWNAVRSSNNGVLRLFLILDIALQFVGPGLSAMLVNFMDPTLERWITQKLLLSALLMAPVVDQLLALILLARYYALWPQPASFAVILGANLLTIVGVMTTYVWTVIRVIKLRRAAPARKAVADDDALPAPPTAAVSRSPDVFVVASDSSEAGAEPARGIYMNPQSIDAFGPTHQDAGGVELTTHDAAPCSNTGMAAAACTKGAEPGKHATSSHGFDAAALVASEQDKEALQSKVQLQRVWESIRQDSTFKYSPFFLVAVLVSAALLVASYIAVLYRLAELKECTLDPKRCINLVQEWLLLRFEASEATALIDAFGVLCGQAQFVGGAESAVGNVCYSFLEVERTFRAQAETWLEESYHAVTVGANMAFFVSFLMGFYAIFRSMWAYKQTTIELKKQVSIEEVMGAAQRACNAEVAFPGADLVHDVRKAQLGLSMYFTGVLASTCYFQMWLLGLFLTVLFGGLLHPAWWRFVFFTKWWWISFVLIILFHVSVQQYISRRVVEGCKIKHPFHFLFIYLLLSTVYCVVAFLLAVRRAIWLMITTLVSLSRLDRCLFTVMHSRDAGYNSFCSIVLLAHALDKIQAEEREVGGDGDSCLQPQPATSDANREKGPQEDSPERVL